MKRILLLFEISVLASAHTACLQGALIFFFFFFLFETNEFPDTSFPVLLRKQTLVCAFRLDPSTWHPVYSVNNPDYVLWEIVHWLLWTYASDPDEVIYDDVPRENSDSNTGLWILIFIPTLHSVLVPVCCSLSFLCPFNSFIWIIHLKC